MRVSPASKAIDLIIRRIWRSLAYNGNGKRLSGESIRQLVSGLCKKVGITKQMSPHRIRHSSITTVLDKNNGNYRATQRFSRHTKPDTVMKYDDNRSKLHSCDDRYIGGFGVT
jgi:integrase/recombinase XerC